MQIRSAVIAVALLTAAAAPSSVAAQAALGAVPFPLAGTWTLLAADLLHADGTRTRDYGASPNGRLLVDADGSYSLQIFKAERPRFRTGNKATGSAAEFEAAVLGSSTHFGTMALDTVAHVLTVNILGASFPNQEGTQQKRHYVLSGDELSYRIPPNSEGNVPISVWHRVR